MTVYIVTQTDRDEFNYDAAKKYGPIEYLFDESFRTGGKRPLSELLNHAKNTIKEKFNEEPEVDHFLIINPGPLLNNALASAIFAYQNGGFLSLLVYNSALGEYTPVHLQTEEEEEDDEPMKGEFVND